MSLFLCYFFCSACSEDENIVGLQLEKTEVAMKPGESETVNIISGNGGYSVYPLDEDLVTATISETTVTITASDNLDGGETNVYVYDSKGTKGKVIVTVAQIFNLTIDATESSIVVGEEKTITVLSGNGDYSIEFADETSADIVGLNTDNLESNSTFKIIGTGEGTANLIITDSESQTLSFSVTVEQGVISVDQSSLSLMGTQSVGVISVLAGSGDYVLSFSEEGIASATIENDVITVTPGVSGTTELTITGSMEDMVVIPITVDVDVDVAINLWDNYCLVVDFAGSPQAESLKSLTQVTYEITFYADNTRGLMTLMGLENNFLLRGEFTDVNPRFEISGDNLQIFSQQTILSDREGGNGPGKWYHVAVVFDGNATTIEEKYKMYINGVQESLTFQNTGGEQSSIDLTYQNQDPAFMFGRAYNQDWRAFYGKLGEARIWKVARTEAEIQAGMCTLSSGYDTDDLVAAWVFNSGLSTSSFSDVSGHGLDAAVYGNVGGFEPKELPVDRYVHKDCPE